MIETTENRYDSDYAVHPGEILEEYLSSLGITQLKLSNCARISLKRVNEILKGQAPITPEIALKLEPVFEKPATALR